jgi:hypothetical protein
MAARTSARQIVDAFVRGDADAVRRRVASDAVFHSPVADYTGDEIGPVLEALMVVMRITDTAAVHGDDNDAVCFFVADVDGRRGDGVLRVVAPDRARATEMTLMLRPLETLMGGVEAMRRALRAGHA